MATPVACPCAAGCEMVTLFQAEGVKLRQQHLEPGEALTVLGPAVLCRGALVERCDESGQALDLHVRGAVLLPQDALPVRLHALTRSAVGHAARADGRPLSAEAQAAFVRAHARALRRRLQVAQKPALEETVSLFLAVKAADAGVRDAAGVLLPLPLTRRLVAEIVGCREESLARLSARWTEEGRIEWSRTGLRLVQPELFGLPGTRR